MASVKVVASKGQFIVTGSKDVQGRDTYEVSKKRHEFILDTGDVFEFWHVDGYGSRGWYVSHAKGNGDGLRITITKSNKSEAVLLRVTGEFSEVKLQVKKDSDVQSK